MKNKILCLGIAMLAISCNRTGEEDMNNLHAKENMPLKIMGKTVEPQKLIIGEVAGYNAEDGDNCRRNRGGCNWAIVGSKTADINFDESNKWEVNYFISDNQLIIINANSVHAKTSTVINISERIALPDDLSEKLGYKSITIMPGTYSYKTDNYEKGYVALDIAKE